MLASSGATIDTPARQGFDRAFLAHLQGWFAVDFNLVDGETGELLQSAPHQQAMDFSVLGELSRIVAQRGRAELLDEESPLLVLAIPARVGFDQSRVAVGVFVVAGATSPSCVELAAQRLGISQESAADWLSKQVGWTASALVSMGQLAVERLAAGRQAATVEAELREVSLQLSATYEEISLLHRLTQNLKLTSNNRELGQHALAWLADAVPAQGLAIKWAERHEVDQLHSGSAGAAEWMTYGQCPIDAHEFQRLVDWFALKPGSQPVVLNAPRIQESDWPWPSIRQLVAVPLAEGEHCFGWIAVMNHVEGGQFGSVEASLLSSVAAILGIHSGNAELYEQQREFFAGLVRALSSAIDAKDPYTCGHSDRVARVAVRLAEELDCDRKQIETVYLSGLLHDVGKIGIDDNVLRKTDKLTTAEFEHIKTHVEIGCRILSGIKQLLDVLPGVMHHHEQWDGRGYPSGLKADEIPFLARIVAVADAFDAMGSDRPYRRGMDDDKLDTIMRDGAGKQWDPQVVDAFFRARDEVRAIAHKEVDRVTLEVRD
ncbi:MAG: HD domain-containing phosphohydrolase [Pirellulales bacterium]